MLTYVRLQNFIFINELSVTFEKGMTVLTGETGSGKSILGDALWLVLGAKPDATVIQVGKHFCYVEAHFVIHNLNTVKAWLIKKQYIEASEQSKLCRIIRRFTSSAHQIWINGKRAKIKDVQWLGTQLVAQHNQHDQQRLLLSDYQRECLDQYGKCIALVKQLETYYEVYLNNEREKERLLELIRHQQDKLSLLKYQLSELEVLHLKPNELVLLDQEQRQLFHAHQIVEYGQSALSLMSEAHPIHLNALLQNIKKTLHHIAQLDNRFEDVYKAFDQASIEIREAEMALQHMLSVVNIDPERLGQVEERIAQLNRLATKYNTSIESLPQLAVHLQAEYESYIANQKALMDCEKAGLSCIEQYHLTAKALSKARSEAALSFEQKVSDKIQSLGMSKGQFKIQLKPIHSDEGSQVLHRFGQEKVFFLLSAAPGQPLQCLSKGASGGELSRLSLVIRNIIADQGKVPTLIFDEVDVGVGGSIAERMGRVLKELSQHRQVLCITHLPQVAVLAEYHYRIEKHTHDQSTRISIVALHHEVERVQEIARMLGGIHVTEQTIAYAKSMLKTGQDC